MNSEQLKKATALNEKIVALTSRIECLEFKMNTGILPSCTPTGITIDTRTDTHWDKVSFMFSHEYFGDISKQAFKILREFLLSELTNELHYTKQEFDKL